MINNKVQSNDVLDQASQQYNRVKAGYSPQNYPDNGVRHQLMLKNIYRQQLDQIMRQKDEQKRLEKQRQNQQRQNYNQRMGFNREAERLKDLSYKNYYQLLLNNQQNIVKNHTVLNAERQLQKQHLVQQSIQQQRIRSQQAWQAEQKRLQREKRNYREELDRQLKQKHLRGAHQNQQKFKQQQAYKKVSFTPHQIAKIERDRKMMEMSKYKEDLQKTSPTIGEKSRIMAANNIIGKNSNDFNIFSQSYHNPMVNPIPFNIQNPYILREFKRKQQTFRDNQIGNVNQNRNSQMQP